MAKRKSYTAEMKKSLRSHSQENKHLTQDQLGEWFHRTYNDTVSQVVVSQWISSKYAYLDLIESTPGTKKKNRKPQYQDLEKALFAWVLETEQSGRLKGKYIIKKAKKFWLQMYKDHPIPLFSNGWLRGFKKRHNIKLRTYHGEAGSLDQTLLPEQREEMRRLVEEYDPADVYNCDETGLFWRQLSNKALSSKTYKGRKSSKSRITAHFCCNADGSDKFIPWIIGDSETPHAFRSNREELATLEFTWRSSAKAWMNTRLMIEWLMAFDAHIGIRKVFSGEPVEKKVILLMDNFSAHKRAAEFCSSSSPLLHTNVSFLPPNTKSALQPLDQGIIKSFKDEYSDRLGTFVLDELDDGRKDLRRMNLFKAVQWTVKSWEFITQSTIRNSWNHSRIIDLPRDEETVASDAQMADAERQEQMTRCFSTRTNLQRRSIIGNDESECFRRDLEEEEVDDFSDDEIDERIIAQYTPATAEATETTEDEIEVIAEITPLPPYRSSREACDALNVICEFARQENLELKRYTDAILHRLTIQRNQSLQQGSITSFFSSNT